MTQLQKPRELEKSVLLDQMEECKKIHAGLVESNNE